jgi:hypothetical protein
MRLNYSSTHKTFVTVSESSKITQVQVTIAINCSTLPYYINTAGDNHANNLSFTWICEVRLVFIIECNFVCEYNYHNSGPNLLSCLLFKIQHFGDCCPCSLVESIQLGPRELACL